MNARQGIPLIPDPDALTDRAISALVRACIATAYARLPAKEGEGRSTPDVYARRAWGSEAGAVEFLLARSASAPATTNASGWAAELANVVAIFLPTLVRLSAGVGLSQMGFQLSFDGAAKIRLPLIAPGTAKFIGQGKPIPVTTYSISPGVELTPFKLASITALTREVMEGGNAEQIVRQALSESVAAGLDAVMFSVGPAITDVQPAGLLFGVGAMTKSAATDKSIAMTDDLAMLVGAVSRIAGSGPIAIVCAPEQAASITLRFPRDVDYAVLPTAALAAGTVIAVATNALASAFGGMPTIEADKQSAIVMNDAPGEVVDIGGVRAAPFASMFQTDTVALKVRMPANWCLRAPGGVAWISGATW